MRKCYGPPGGGGDLGHGVRSLPTLALGDESLVSTHYRGACRCRIQCSADLGAAELFIQGLRGLYTGDALLMAEQEPDRGRRAQGVATARNGMVATSQPLAAQAGVRILRRGGNAIDAAVATAAVLAVVEPMSTGPGGDMFALVHVAKTGELAGLNGSGFAPRAVDCEFFAERGLEAIPTRGPFAVTVPGAVEGWATLLGRYGSMTLKDVLAPAIEYAENGFAVTEVIAGDWADCGASYREDPEFADAYYRDGRPPARGEIFVNQALGETLRQIAEGGSDVFYHGEIARKIVACLNGLGWPMTIEDMAYQRSEWVEPISTTYKGYRVYELPPNGQGMAALEMLNILEAFDLAELGHNSAEYLHLLIEAKKLAFADLAAWLADPARAELPVATITSQDYAETQRRRIDPKSAAEDPASGINDPVKWLPPAGDTVYLSVVDGDRNAVSFINSLFMGFGSGVVVPKTGILLQNRGALFSVDPDHPNRIEGHKRPYHTIIPAMAYKDGKPWFSFGVMGGHMQPQGHVQVLLNRIEFGMDVQQAGSAPRVRHDRAAGVALESPIPGSVAAQLKDMGHAMASTDLSFGGYQGIEIDWQRGVLLGGSDPRKDGLAAGW